MSDLRAHRVVLLSSPVADSLTSVLDERQERDGEGSQVGDKAEEARGPGGQQHEKADREQRIDVEARGDGRLESPPGDEEENGRRQPGEEAGRLYELDRPRPDEEQA